MIHHNGKDIKYINEDNDISLSGEDYGEYYLKRNHESSEEHLEPTH